MCAIYLLIIIYKYFNYMYICIYLYIYIYSSKCKFPFWCNFLRATVYLLQKKGSQYNFRGIIIRERIFLKYGIELKSVILHLTEMRI
jgi:hypothetical protein